MKNFFSKFALDDREPLFLTIIKIVFLAITIVFGLFLFFIVTILTHGFTLIVFVVFMFVYILMNSTT